MKRVLFTLSLSLALPLAAAPPGPPPLSDSRWAIGAIYARQDAAFGHRDVGGALYGCAPNYHEIHTEPGVRGMTFSLAQLRPMIQATLRPARAASRQTLIERITLTPGGATVRVTQHLTVSMRDPKSAKYGTVLTNCVSEDTWVRGKKGWQETRSVVLSGRTKVFIHNVK